MLVPTAMQFLEETHEMPPSNAVPTLGEDSMDHSLPFQRSIKGVPVSEVVFREEPTAVHPSSDQQEIPKRNPAIAPAGSGGEVALHSPPPLRVAASGFASPAFSLLSPTATQAVAEGQDTPSSSFSRLPGLGDDTIVQAANVESALASATTKVATSTTATMLERLRSAGAQRGRLKVAWSRSGMCLLP